MTRTRRFLDGVILSYMNQIFVMLAGLWLTPFLLGHLGQHDFGLWLIGLKALSYLTLLDIGVLALLPREVAFAKGRIALGGHTSSIKLLVEETTFVVFTQLPLVAGACMIAWALIPKGDGRFRNVVGILLAVFVTQFPLKVAYAALEGLQELRYLGLLQFVSWAVGLIVNVGLIMMGRGLYGLAFGWAATQAVISVGSLWKLYCSYPDVAPGCLRTIAWARYREIIGSGIWIGLGQVAQLLRTSDFVLIGKILGPSAVVPYSCTGKLVAIGQNQPLAIMQSAQPALSEIRQAKQKKHVARVVALLTQAMLLVSGVVSVVILSVNRAFILRWVGPAQDLGFAFTVLLLLDMLARHWNVTTVYSLFAFGQQKHISTVAVIDGALTAAMSGMLIILLGPLGAPLASLSVVVIVSLPWNLNRLKKELDCSVWELISSLVPWMVRFVPLFLLVGAFGTLFLPKDYLMVGVGSAVVCLAYAASQWTVFAKSPLYEYAKQQLKCVERPAKQPTVVTR